MLLIVFLEPFCPRDCHRLQPLPHPAQTGRVQPGTSLCWCWQLLLAEVSRAAWAGELVFCPQESSSAGLLGSTRAVCMEKRMSYRDFNNVCMFVASVASLALCCEVVGTPLLTGEGGKG